MKIKLAIIGAGKISRYHLDALKNISCIDVAAICDTNEDIAKKRAEKYGITKYYTDYNDILSDVTIDAVDIATPTFTIAKSLQMH